MQNQDTPFQNPMTQPLYPAGSREARAEALLDAGAVQLYPGRGYALVTGSKSSVYKITKAGCPCPDRQFRGEPCYHEIATRWLCDAYKMMVFRAKRHGRTRLPSALGRALVGVSTPAAVTPIRAKVAA